MTDYELQCAKEQAQRMAVKYSNDDEVYELARLAEEVIDVLQKIRAAE